MTNLSKYFVIYAFMSIAGLLADTASAGGPAYCGENLRNQGITNPFEIQKKCSICFQNSYDPICQDQSSKNNRRSGDSYGGRNGSLSRSGNDYSALGTQQLYRDPESGAARDCLEQVGKSGMLMGEISITYRNRCSKTIVLEGICGSAGLRPIESSDEYNIHGESSRTVQCKK